MVMYKCDSCKGVYKDLDERYTVKVFRDGIREDAYDICPNCIGAVRRAILTVGAPDACENEMED